MSKFVGTPDESRVTSDPEPPIFYWAVWLRSQGLIDASDELRARRFIAWSKDHTVTPELRNSLEFNGLHDLLRAIS